MSTTFKKKKRDGRQVASVTAALFKRGNYYRLEFSTNITDDVWELSGITNPNGPNNTMCLMWPEGDTLKKIFHEIAQVVDIDFSNEDWNLILDQGAMYLPPLEPSEDNEVYDLQIPLEFNRIFGELRYYLKTGKTPGAGE
mgnify:CR=1 FL=1